MTAEYSFTWGASHTQANWADARHLSWPKMVEMLTSHVPGAKEGSCVVPAVFTGAQRKKDDAARIDVAFLDSDSGATLDDIRTALMEKGWEAVVSSTHSHMTTDTKVSLVNWNRYFSKFPQATPTQFLIDEKGYLPHVAAEAEAVTSDDTYVFLHHQPCPKFRIVLPLARPWIATSYPTQAGANAIWKERIEALAAALNLSHDQACTDTSRLFYLPRRPPHGAVPQTAITEGQFCDIFALPKPALNGHANGYANGHTLFDQPKRVNGHAYQDSGKLEYSDPITGEFVDLADWAKATGRTFLIAGALKAKRPGVFTGLITDNCKVHIDCPNAHAHTDPGRDDATFVINAGRATSEGFVIHCRHGHCTGKDRLFFVRRMLEERWIEIDDLTDEKFQIPVPPIVPPTVPGERHEKTEEFPVPPHPLLDASAFMATFTNPDYLIDGIIQRGRVHALTSMTGHGKTATALLLGCSIDQGWNIGNIEVTQGEVIFLAGENPDDLCGRFFAACQHYGISPDNLRMRVMPGNFPMDAEAAEKLKQVIDASGRPPALIIADSAAAYFHGDDENQNVQMGAFARNFRALTQCKGNPAVLILTHPTKNPGKENLIPRGGGAFLNEIDVNLTLWADAQETSTLHWQGKIRGADFQPVNFSLKQVKIMEKTDAKGRPFVSIVAALQTEEQAHKVIVQTVTDENTVLEWLRRTPGISLSNIATNAGWFTEKGEASKRKVQRLLGVLAHNKLARNWRGKWQITEAGRKELEHQ